MRPVSRRQFLGSLGGSVLVLTAGCTPLRFGHAPAVRRLAVLSGSPPNPTNDAHMAALSQRLHELGYSEGQNLVIEERRGDGDERLAEPAAELVDLQPDIILVHSSVGARAMQRATGTIPIVSAGIGDLVATGVVASLARPGGNVTGLSTPPLGPKQLQLLQEVAPGSSRVAVLFDTTVPTSPQTQFAAPARALGLEIVLTGAERIEALEPAVDTAVSGRADSVIVVPGPLITANQARIAELLVSRRLPSMWAQSEAIPRGGLMAYGPNRDEQYRRAADYVDRILRGAKPADLPVEQPARFDFIINLKAAQAIGLTVPPTVLAQATEVLR